MHFFKIFLIWIFFFFWSLLNLLLHCFCFGVFGCEACGILGPRPGIEPAPSALKGGLLTLEHQGKSLLCILIACVCLVAPCPALCDPMDCSPPGSSVHGDSPGKNAGVDCHALLPGIFPTQGSNPDLPHCRRLLYYLSYQGSPRLLEWVAYPFCSRTS